MQTVPVAVPGAAYEIAIGDQALAALPEVLRRNCPAAAYALIADDTVADLYGHRVREVIAAAAPCHLLSFAPGERSKVRDTWATLSDAMSAAGIGRDGAVVALGGGVTGDLAGFVAATYRRGVPLVQLPTTVLAMVDSSVGGKTGLDTPHGKNLVGAFHQPRAVVADVALLRTLPERHMRAGLAEAVKHGAVADRAHVVAIDRNVAALLSRDPAPLAAVIAQSVAIKAEIVAADVTERGRRAILNFGHTIGHALEAASGYDLLHGEAIAVGMVLEARLGERLGVTAPGTAQAVMELLEGLGLRTQPPHHDPDTLLGLMRQDKKVRDGTVNFAFLKELGQAATSGPESWTFPVAERDIKTLITS